MALQMVFVEPTPSSSSSSVNGMAVVAASSSALVSEQNALAETLMNLAGSASPPSHTDFDEEEEEVEMDEVPSSTGAQQFTQQRSHSHLELPRPVHTQGQHHPPSSVGLGSSSPLLLMLQADPMSSPRKAASPYPPSPSKFYKNKRKTYPVRSPHMEHRQSPPGIVFQFPSAFIKEGSEHLSPKLNVIFYPENPPSPPKHVNSSPPQQTLQAPQPQQRAATARGRSSARAKPAHSRFQQQQQGQLFGLALENIEGLKSKRRARAKDKDKEAATDASVDSDSIVEDDDDDDDDDQDLRGAEQLALLSGESGLKAKPKPKKRRAAVLEDGDGARKTKKPRREKSTSVQASTPQSQNDSDFTGESRSKRIRHAVVRDDGNASDDFGDDDELASSPKKEKVKAAQAPSSSSSSSSKKVCASCGTTNTPYWRDGWHTCTLCNACGIRFQKYKVHNTQTLFFQQTNHRAPKANRVFFSSNSLR